MTFRIEPAPVVVDASVAVEHLLDPRPEVGAALLDWVERDRLRLVPAGFWPEVANALLVGNRVTAERVQTYLVRLRDLGIETADRGLRALIEAIELAAKHRLTVYDALYLEMAIDTDATLATLDRDLARAAVAEGVELEPIGEPGGAGAPGEPA